MTVVLADKRVRLLILDGSGTNTSRKDWSAAVRWAHFAVYLVDARSLCGCLAWVEDRSTVRLKDDLKLLKERTGDRLAAKCLLVVTHPDEDCRIRWMKEEEGVTVTADHHKKLLKDQISEFDTDAASWQRVEVITSRLPEAADVLTELLALRKQRRSHRNDPS